MHTPQVSTKKLFLEGFEKVENLEDLPEVLESVDPFLEEAANITYDVLTMGKYAIHK